MASPFSRVSTCHSATGARLLQPTNCFRVLLRKLSASSLSRLWPGYLGSKFSPSRTSAAASSVVHVVNNVYSFKERTVGRLINALELSDREVFENTCIDIGDIAGILLGNQLPRLPSTWLAQRNVVDALGDSMDMLAPVTTG